jgi:hypothetical protein
MFRNEHSSRGCSSFAVILEVFATLPFLITQIFKTSDALAVSYSSARLQISHLVWGSTSFFYIPSLCASNCGWIVYSQARLVIRLCSLFRALLLSTKWPYRLYHPFDVITQERTWGLCDSTHEAPSVETSASFCIYTRALYIIDPASCSAVPLGMVLQYELCVLDC